MASLQISSSILDQEYLKVDEGSNTRIYKDKNLTEKTKRELTDELNRKWPHIQLKLKPFNQHNIQSNYTTITAGIKECCDKILKKKNNTHSKHTHGPYMGNRELGQLKKMKKIIIKNKREVIQAMIHHTPLEDLKIDTTYSVYITSKEDITKEITQTKWTEETIANPQEWLASTSKDLKKISKINDKLIKGMKQNNINIAIKKLNSSFKRGLQYFWTKVTGQNETHSDITSVEYTEHPTGKKVKSNNNGVVKKKFRKSWKKQYTKTTHNNTNQNRRWYKNNKNRQPPSISLTQEITIEEVSEVIKDRNDTTPGTDSVSMAIITLLPEQYMTALTKIYNLCLQGGTLPKEWQEGQITLIYKKGAKHDPTNYRPITLLQNIYKIYSQIITNRLAQYSNKYVLHITQSGFRKGKSIIDSTRAYKDIIEDSLINNKELHACYIDLQKAFDSVQYWHIDKALKYYKVDPKLRAAIANIYKNRTARVKINKQITPSFQVNQGTAQGDPLSPLLFIICLNPLIEKLNNTNWGYKMRYGPRIASLAYCDDIVLLAHTHQHMVQLTSMLESYGTTHNLIVNGSKSAYTNNSTTPTPHLTIHKQKIPSIAPSESYKYLGIYFNINLNWEKQQAEVDRRYKWRNTVLRSKNLTPQQVVAVINSVANAYITYTLGICHYEDSWLKAMDQVGANTVRFKLGLGEGHDNAFLYASPEGGGLNLEDLHSVNQEKQACLTIKQLQSKTIASYTIVAAHRANSRDTPNSTLHRWSQQLNRVQFTVENKRLDSGKLIPTLPNISAQTKKALKLSHLIYKQDLIKGTEIRNFHELSTQTVQKFTYTAWEEVKEHLCYPHSTQIKSTGTEVYTLPKRVKHRSSNNLLKIDNEVWVWTDASLQQDTKGKNTLTSAVFFLRNSPYNKVFQTKGVHCSSFLGEVAAIQEALERAPQEENIHIITDSLSAIISIKGYKAKKHTKKRYQIGRSYLKNINKNIKKREETGKRVRISHIFSHIKHKKAKALAHSPEAVTALATKLNLMKQNYKTMWTVAKKGNIAADKLASKTHKIKGDKRRPDSFQIPKTDKVRVKDSNNWLVEKNPATILKNNRKIKRNTKLQQYTAAGEILRDPHTHYPLSNMYLHTRAGKRARNRKIAFKGRYRRLPTRDQGFRRNYNIVGDLIVKKDKGEFKNAKHHIKKKVDRKVFLDQACAECSSYHKENTTHIYSGECEARHTTQDRVADSLRTLLVNENVIGENIIDYLPLWVPDPYQPMPEENTGIEEWRALKAYPKAFGALGMIPTALVKLIKNSPSRTPINIIILKIQDIVLEGAADMWADRQRAQAEKFQIATITKIARARYKEKMGD
jgi:hypothetical protein